MKVPHDSCRRVSYKLEKGEVKEGWEVSLSAKLNIRLLIPNFIIYQKIDGLSAESTRIFGHSKAQIITRGVFLAFHAPLKRRFV